MTDDTDVDKSSCIKLKTQQAAGSGGTGGKFRRNLNDGNLFTAPGG